MTKEKLDAPTPQLARSQVIKLGRLLHMKYRPAEIADLLGVHVETVRRSYLAAGCPHKRDANGHIWIVGTEFRDWAKDVIAKRKRSVSEPLADDEAWCFKCKCRIEMIDPQVIWANRYIEIQQCVCQDCGTKVNRAAKRES